MNDEVFKHIKICKMLVDAVEHYFLKAEATESCEHDFYAELTFKSTNDLLRGIMDLNLKMSEYRNGGSM